jgi:hypothetical protein
MPPDRLIRSKDFLQRADWAKSPFGHLGQKGLKKRKYGCLHFGERRFSSSFDVFMGKLV